MRSSLFASIAYMLVVGMACTTSHSDENLLIEERIQEVRMIMEKYGYQPDQYLFRDEKNLLKLDLETLETEVSQFVKWRDSINAKAVEDSILAVQIGEELKQAERNPEAFNKILEKYGIKNASNAKEVLTPIK